MKTRTGLVSNSSSTAFIIVNTSDDKKTIVDFVNENPQLVREFNEMYDDNITQQQMVDCAKRRLNQFKSYLKISKGKKGTYKSRSNGIVWNPNESQYAVFGDEQGDHLGRVFDYILRDGGSSKNFTWRFEEMCR